MAIEKVIRPEQGEDAAGYQRWQLPEVDSNRLERAQRGTTVEALEALQQAAYDEAYAKGLAEGRRQGETEGYRHGVKQGTDEGRALVQRVESVLRALAEPLEQLDEEVEEQLLELSLALTRQVVRREIQTQPGEIIGIIREAVALLPLGQRRVEIRLHPDDARFVRETLGDLEAASWSLLEDPSLSRGGCRVSTDTSRIDASLEQRLAVLARELLGGDREDDQEGQA